MYNCPENTEIVINDFSPVESSMDNEEYFDWTDSLKLDEKFSEEKNGRKRKLNGNSSSDVSKLRANGIKVLKGNAETNIDAVKQSGSKKSDGQNEGKWTFYYASIHIKLIAVTLETLSARLYVYLLEFMANVYCIDRYIFLSTVYKFTNLIFKYV